MGDAPGPSTAPYFNPRKATENFSRLCQLIMTICSDLFRDILSRYIKPADLRQELDNNRTKLERIMNAQQKEQIYPSSGTTTLTSKDLDISVLYILLRNICKIPKHQNGWGNPPLDTDTRLAASIERIRIQRNSISAHSTIGEIEDTVFQDHWDELKNSILEIEKQLIGGDMFERGVDELLSCDLNPTRAEKYVKEFKNIQGELLIKREKMESFESTLKTTKRHLAVKRARLDDVEEQQASTTSQIKDLQTTLLTYMQVRAMGDVPGPSTAPYFSPRKETDNFSRLCQLIMTICSDLFRDILSRYLTPADLRLELDNNRTRLERIMNAQQKEQIYPPSGITTLTSKDLDISVLYILLRNICKIPKHQNGWGKTPLNTDTRLAACIERIRIRRNLISAHSTIGEIEDTVFQDHWNELKNSILEIEKQLIGGDMYERGVDELLSCDLNPTRAEKYVKEFKNIQGKLLIKREKMESFESTLNTTKRHLAVKRARLDDVEEQQASTTSQIKDLQTTLLTSMQDTFKDLETTLLTTIQARFAAMGEKQQATQASSTKGRKRAPQRKSSTTCPSAVWRSDITLAGYQSFDYMSFVTPTTFWMMSGKRLLKMDASGNILCNNESLKIDSASNNGGFHTVTQKGDLLFLESNYVKKFTSEETITTLIAADPEATFACIHSCSDGSILAGVDYSACQNNIQFPGVILSNCSKIVRYNEEGISIQVIQKDDQGKDIYKYRTIVNITENTKNQDILASNYSVVKCVEKTGRYKFSYKGHFKDKYFTPTDISTDSLGQILVCNTPWRTSSIHVLNHEGYFICFLLTDKKDGIRSPLSICVNEKEFYLLNVNSNRISVYDYQPE